MHERIELDLEYKGGRDYLHGSDLFERGTEALQRRLGAGYIAKLTLRRFAHRQCDLTLGDMAPPDACGQGLYREDGGGTHRFCLVETARPVTGRYPFDEDALVVSAVMDLERRSATLPARSARRPIEEAIALTKLLQYRMMPLAAGRWVLGQLEFQCALGDKHRSTSVRLRSSIAGRYGVNELLLDGVAVGRIDFVVASR